jgi:protein CpxP
MMAMHGMHGMHGAADPAKMEKHLDRMLSHMLPDLTDAQKTSIKGIVSAAATDMKTFHEQHKALHTAEVNILTAATVDRTALEQNRVDAMRLMEQMSKRKNTAMADAADVLTPAQRAKVGETLKARMAKHMEHGAAGMMR